MTSELFAFAASFLLVGFASTTVPGCVRNDNCAATPDRPTPVGPVGNLKVIGYDNTFIEVPLDIAPENATLEITGDSVVILYRQDTLNYRVEYQVVGPLLY
jgi:hypothetical protein